MEVLSGGNCMWYILATVGILICGIQALRAQRQLVSALWLAGTSALAAVLLYLLGAPEVAVIELSVGAGLVTVLFVFAINIAGDEAVVLKSILPKPLSWILVTAAVLLLGWMILPSLNIPLPAPLSQSFSTSLWVDRKLDVLLQAALIFAGVLGVLGLLAEEQAHPSKEKRS